MSIQAVAWALDQDLPARPKLVLVSIANHANHADGYCWLKAETIAQEASCSPRGVFNFVGDLIRNGYVRKALRRADDGRQRANDYWILIDRVPAPWVAAGKADVEPEAEIEAEAEGAEPQAIAEHETQDVVEPHAPGACGESVGQPVENSIQTAPGAVGPHAPVCMHKDSAEPSKTNPKKEPAAAYRPRGYRPPPQPPPQPMGSTTVDGSGELVFVYEGTRAYEAWAKLKEAERRKKGDYRPFRSVTTREGRFGWYFPSLFPPQERPPPEAGTLMTADDVKEFSKLG